MIVIVDTREQAPLEFTHPWVTEVKREKLDVGDYAVEFKDGYRPSIVFERKSISDLFGTLGNGYKRFKNEIIRANKSDTTMLLIVEGTLMDVANGYKHSKIDGMSIIAKMFTLWVKYGIIPIYTRSREEMSLYITNFYLSAGKDYIRRKNEGKKKGDAKR